MGRNSTGAITTGASLRIELSYLLKKGFISNGCIKQGTLTWTNGSYISFTSELSAEGQYIRLTYSSKSHTGELTSMDYTIQLTSVPSNLGRGKIWYFICPISGNRSRILYKAYGSTHFKSRASYRNRIYYETQICNKLYYHSERFHSIERELERLKPLVKKKCYQGKETRLNTRILLLEKQREFHDWAAYMSLARCFRK